MVLKSPSLYSGAMSPLYKIVLHLFLLVPVTGGMANTVYKHVDEKGRVTYSSQESENTEAVEIKEPNIVSIPESSPVFEEMRLEREKRQAEKKAERYRSVKIIYPEEGETMVLEGWPISFTARAASSPELMKGHYMRFYLDDYTIGGLTENNSILINSLHRGAYRIKVEIVNAEGKVLKTSEEVTFRVHQNSIYNNRYYDWYPVRPIAPIHPGSRPKPLPKPVPLVK